MIEVLANTAKPQQSYFATNSGLPFYFQEPILDHFY